MQKIKVFSVWDKKALAYMNPFYYLQTGQAIRGFSDAVNDPQSPFFKHPEDFTLFQVGEWDDRDGRLGALEQPILVEEALNVKNKE